MILNTSSNQTWNARILTLLRTSTTGEPTTAEWATISSNADKAYSSNVFTQSTTNNVTSADDTTSEAAVTKGRTNLCLSLFTNERNLTWKTNHKLESVTYFVLTIPGVS